MTHPHTEARDRTVILVLLIATFVVILNETIMNVALPRLMTDLRVNASTVQWLSTAFMLTMAVVIPTTGFLLQRLTSRAVFLTAMTLFSVGTLVAGLAGNFPILLGARIIQATGTAIMLPLLMTTILTLIPPERRGAVMGNISIVISVAPAIGPTISGVILQTLSWRAMFLFVLPIALGVLAYGARTLVNITEPRRLSLDVLSVPLSALGFGGIVYGLSRLGDTPGGVSTPTVAVPLVVSVVSLALFIARQVALQRRDAPLLDLRAFRYPMFTLGVALMMIAMMALFGGAILLPIYLQNVRGLTALQTGLLLLPGGLLMGLLAPPVGKLFDRYGPVWLATPGAALLTLALWQFGTITPGTSIAALLALHLTLSAGLALLFTPVFTASLGPLPMHLYSHGSAILSTLQQVAGAAGTALLITIMTGRSAALVQSAVTPQLALNAGLQSAFMVAAGISVLAVVLAVFTRRPAGHPHGAPDGHPVSAH
ncbi:MDR family MFS transporter [Deinococcus maricopensis]|uniref:Drug resistance transporter, EmrB/QacA subfamily n=1 Tax=Deinococcus maricopensis (strain DSM 21211 / LMG 22137 / NRRL B-23946 / LB-34) TaxID=709986 RepID=E8U4V2_DEIML|nr:MDR family MFS transporter [Deinococcus maricopensis]ADV66091.1 drug resistance transporter, EmrB/QacA subfamily [Deinococcus maricopensis DSM 21211]